MGPAHVMEPGPVKKGPRALGRESFFVVDFSVGACAAEITERRGERERGERDFMFRSF